jgi:hypothetical protein
VSLILVDVETPFGVGAPSVGDMTEFGAVEFNSRRTFHGHDCSRETFEAFAAWLAEVSKGRPIFVSDNPAFDFQWINFYFWRYLGANPFGHSARRIGDFAAGLARDFYARQTWKSLRITPHDHNPVNDAMGNAEALATLIEISKQERKP